MISRALASPRAARSWHLQLAQPSLMLLPTFTSWEGWQRVSCLASFSSAQLTEVAVDLLDSTTGNPKVHSLCHHRLYSQSLPEPGHLFILSSKGCFTELLLWTGHLQVPPWDTSVKKIDKDPLPFWRLCSSTQRQIISSRNNKRILKYLIRRWVRRSEETGIGVCVCGLQF